MDHHLQATQYGFRRKKGTADAIQYIRRMIDKGEMTNTKTLLVLLDWEKAFDKVDHAKLLEALERMRVPRQVVNIIKALYIKPQFCVSMEGKVSEWRVQETGIRQGCPLSPYLFIILMTVMFHDIHQNDQLNVARQRVRGTEHDEVLYADDTICIAQSMAAVNRMLNAIGREGANYGLKLNKGKCKYLGIGNPGPVRFADGGKLKPVDEVKYLGCVLNNKDNAAKEVNRRIVECMITMKRLHIFFYSSDCTIAKKLQVFNAVIRSKLMYGLESAIMNQSVLNKLDAFQLKGLRKILKLKTTFYDRDNTNRRVLELATRGMGNKDEQIQLLSEFHMSRRKWMLAKLITLKHHDPSARVALEVETLMPHDYGKKRVGRPRLNWVKCTMADFWEEAKKEYNEINTAGVLNLQDPRHREYITRLAGKYNDRHHFDEHICHLAETLLEEPP